MSTTTPGSGGAPPPRPPSHGPRARRPAPTEQPNERPTGQLEVLDELLDDGRQDDFVGGRDLTHWPTAAGRALHAAAVRARRWLAPREVWALTLVVGLVVTAAFTAAAAGVYDAVVEGDGVTGLDQPALQLALQHRSPGLDTAVTFYTDIGGPVGMPLLAAATAAALAIAWRRWTPVTLLVTTMLGSLALTMAGKASVGRARPPLADAVPPYEHSFSFPSGHTLNATAFAGIVAYLLLRRLRAAWARRLVVVVAVLFAVTIGLSRIFLGHHWFTDVLVAWVLGLAWLGVVITGHRLYLTLRRGQHSAGGGSGGGPRDR
ncbi:phosphatase PAP2 family protein [Quadrisphaera oryzae]|uniref:phosphatase PAP2 family protein n=1 Tax=Quadrisphaera TaxID=317661 RepID=UPI001C96D74D